MFYFPWLETVITLTACACCFIAGVSTGLIMRLKRKLDIEDHECSAEKLYLGILVRLDQIQAQADKLDIQYGNLSSRLKAIGL